ncbi:MAG: sigma-70 family RNA polymerase sigma factor [Planctomycetes bacterium]|nr:sigma-70 family RNA polymerase sigma factor [Planctomycetota bacterium]
MTSVTARSDEQALIARLRAGEEAAFTELVTIYGPRMLAVAMRYLKNEPDAQDALQDAFISAFRKFDTFQGGSALGTWLHSIVVRAALMRLRTYRSQETTSIDDFLPKYTTNFDHRVNPRAAWVGSADDNAQRREVRDLVRKGVEMLPEIYRVVVLLRDIEGLDTAETAKLLGLTETVIKTRLHRGRQALREILDPMLSEANRP